MEGAQEKLILEMTDFAYSPAVPGGNTAQLPRAFVQFIGNCLKQGFKEQVGQLLDSTSSHIVTSLSPKSPVHMMETKSVEEFMQTLASTLQEHNMTPVPSVGDLIEALIRRYILVDAPTYPTKLLGWAHKPRGCKKDDCTDCKDLDIFLGATDETEARFSMHEKRRKHLECQLLMAYGFTPHLFQCTTDKKRSPHTLVVRKMHQGKEFDDDVKRYELQLNKLKERLRPLQQNYVEQVMGETRYRELVMLESTRTSDSGEQVAGHDEKTKADDSMGDSKPAKRRRK